MAPPKDAQEEQKSASNQSLGGALLAYALGAVTVGSVMLARALRKKLRRRRRVVSEAGCDPRARGLRIPFSHPGMIDDNAKKA